MCAAVYPIRSTQAAALTVLCPQRQQKQRQLLGRLQDLLLGPKADEQTTCEVLDYFLRRLGSSQVASRVLAMKVSERLAVVVDGPSGLTTSHLLVKCSTNH